MTVTNYIDAAALQKDVAINGDDINSGLISQPALYVYYTMLAGKARRQRDQKKNTLTTVRAALARSYRAELGASKARVTEAQVDSMVETDARYRAAQEELAEAEQIAYVAETVIFAFNQRKDALLQLARNDIGDRINNTSTMRVVAPNGSMDIDVRRGSLTDEGARLMEEYAARELAASELAASELEKKIRSAGSFKAN